MTFETNRVICGDAFLSLSQMPNQLCDMCVTSPPYYGLRDYGVNEQIGLESSPEEYISKLVNVFREVHRVLRDDGTLWINIGDSYAGSGKGAATHPKGTEKFKQGSNKGCVGQERIATTGNGHCKAKDLIGIPWMLAFALRDEGWYLRQDIIWSKPNPMPESVLDRCTKSHEHILLLSKNKKYRFNAGAIAEKTVYQPGTRADKKRGDFKGKYHAHEDFKHISDSFRAIRETRNKRDVWSVATKPYRGAHFATFPEELIKPCILAGSEIGGVVLDPFGGAGTTAKVALELRRRFVLTEINQDYCSIIDQRIRPLLNQSRLSL